VARPERSKSVLRVLKNYTHAWTGQKIGSCRNGGSLYFCWIRLWLLSL